MYRKILTVFILAFFVKSHAQDSLLFNRGDTINSKQFIDWAKQSVSLFVNGKNNLYIGALALIACGKEHHN